MPHQMSCRYAALALTTAAPLALAQAGTIDVPLDLSSQFNINSPYDPIGPLGAFESPQGVPFELGTNPALFMWSGDWTDRTTCCAVAELSIDTDLARAETVFMLINTAWGQAGPTSYISVEFFGDGGAYHRHDLVGNVDVRDWRMTSWTNFLDPDGITENAWSGSHPTWGDVRIDMQRFDLPAAFADQTLERIIVTDTGRRDFQRALVTAATARISSCKADVDGDGELTLFDFLAFQNLFSAEDMAADCDGDGELTIFDFLAFQNAFAGGCA
ncbi:MAG: hypothetical protein NCW75_03990 [Phycisphaera sp.]|nr:MAG: hypothetical protein NCW75_03990 [Phycisphaera sp.]